VTDLLRKELTPDETLALLNRGEQVLRRVFSIQLQNGGKSRAEAEAMVSVVLAVLREMVADGTLPFLFVNGALAVKASVLEKATSKYLDRKIKMSS